MTIQVAGCTSDSLLQNTLWKHCVLLAIVGLFFSHHCAEAAETRRAYSGTVVSVIDGDSIKVRHRGTNRHIRLWGIDAPEWDQPHAHHAKTLLRNTLLGREVVVEPYYLDDYKRSIAQVFLEKKSINQLLIERGYAWVHVYYCKNGICDEWKRLQARAKKRGDGLWRNRQAVPPWKWKRMKRR